MLQSVSVYDDILVTSLGLDCALSMGYGLSPIPPLILAVLRTVDRQIPLYFSFHVFLYASLSQLVP